MSPLLRRWLQPALLVLVVLAVYGQVLDHQFTAWDDHSYVDRNPHVLQGLDWAGLRWAFTSGDHSNYHPLTWLSHQLDIELYGRWAGGHAFTNLLLHAVNSLLLFGLIRKLTDRPGVAFFVALLFAVHPLNVEAVANISQRKSVLGTCFGLLALQAYGGYARNGNWARYALAVIWAALSLLSKALLVTLPCLFLLLDYWPLRRTPWLGYASTDGTTRPVGWWRLLLEKLPFLALSATISLLTLKFQDETGAMDTAGVDALTSLTGALGSYVFYLGKMLWPTGLAPFYPLPETFPWYVLPVSVAILAAITLACLRLHRNQPQLLVGWLWFGLVLIPMAGFVRVGGMAAADRYCYVPLIGLFLAAILTLARLMEEQARSWRWARPLAVAVGGLVSLGFATVAHRQVAFWKDTETSFNRILATQGPHDVFPALIGYDLFDRGEFARAIPYFRQSLAVAPGNDRVAANLGIALYCTGNHDEAERWLRKAVTASAHKYPGALNALARIAESKGDATSALALYREVVQLVPTSLPPRLALVALLRKEGHLPEAVAAVEEGLRIHPADSTLLALQAELAGKDAGRQNPPASPRSP